LILLWLLQAVVRTAPRQEPVEPSVSLLVAAYNEAAVIGDKIRNSLALDYPAGKLEIVVASDGSKDATAEIVRSFHENETESGGRIRLLNYEQNRGKMAVLNDAVREMRGDIVAFPTLRACWPPILSASWCRALTTRAWARPAEFIACSRKIRPNSERKKISTGNTKPF
jgi:glycosyltransferase involved in cell wall biosynthesis